MKLSRRFKFYFRLVCAAIYFTGLCVWYFQKFVRVENSFGEDHHWAEALLLHSHGIVAYFVTLGVGYLVRVHIMPGLRGKRKKYSGVQMLLVTGILIVSAFPILYASEGLFRNYSIFIHVYLGIAAPVLLLLHIYPRVAAGSNRSIRAP